MWVSRGTQCASKFMNFRNLFPGLKPLVFPPGNIVGGINYSTSNKGAVMLEFFNDIAALSSTLSQFYIINLYDQKKSTVALIKLLQKEKVLQ